MLGLNPVVTMHRVKIEPERRHVEQTPRRMHLGLAANLRMKLTSW